MYGKAILASDGARLWTACEGDEESDSAEK
jgi:hypothetical protein